MYCFTNAIIIIDERREEADHEFANKLETDKFSPNFDVSCDSSPKLLIKSRQIRLIK